MEAVDLLPASALQMEPFQEDKRLLPDHLSASASPPDRVFTPEG